jgi:hypothetical protein
VLTTTVSGVRELRHKFLNFFYKSEICALLGFYTELNGNSISTLWDNQLVPLSEVKQSKTNGLCDS